MSGLIRSDDVRRQNRQRVISAVRRNQVIARVDISATTALSPATVSTITTDLLNENVLTSPDTNGQHRGNRGRPRVSLALNPDTARIAIVIIQFNRIVTAIVNYVGESMIEITEGAETLTLDSCGLVDVIRQQIDKALASQSMTAREISHIVVCFQGTTDVDGNKLLWTPITPSRNVPVSGQLQAVFSVPVTVRNDCDMIALAISQSHDHDFGGNFAAILLSQGVGMGLVLNGELVNGMFSSAMEFGHMVHIPNGALCRCGRRGCIEAYAGDYAIMRRASGKNDTDAPKGLGSQVDLVSIAAAARSGNHDALQALETAGEALGFGLASLFALLDPLPVAFVGRGTVAFDIMKPKLLQALASTSIQGEATEPEIALFPKALPLIIQGCAIEALTAVDGDIAASFHLRDAHGARAS